MKHIIVFSMLLFIACESNSENKDSNKQSLIKLYEKTSNNHKFLIYSNDNSIKIGYKKFYIKVEKEGLALTQATLSVQPMMDMGSHKHSAPYENPSSTHSNSDGLFETAVVFQMSGIWSLEFKSIVGLDTNKIKIDTVNVMSSQLVKKLTGSDGATYFMTMKDSIYKVGLNSACFLLHKKASMMSFPAVTDYSMEMTPWMPSMNHGSNNNINPAHNENGHYDGKVNFSMSGDWEIRIKLNNAINDSISNTTFTLDI